MGINLKSIHLTKKMTTMKKLFLVLAIGAFAACNNSSSTETKTDTAAATKTDTAAAMKADTSAVKADTSKKAVDTTKK
jgi:uncharacterized lipoprotein YajG